MPTRVAAVAVAGDLVSARRGFVTRRRTPATPTANVAPVRAPPLAVFDVVHYPAGPGPMLAYVTPAGGSRSATRPAGRAAVVWCHGSFGGIDPSIAFRMPAEADMSPEAFVRAGFVLMVPSWRGTSGNPGRTELLLGEVDDVLAAVDYVRRRPDVDADRVYVVGEGMGGTLAILVAEAAPPGSVRAVASIDGGGEMGWLASGRMAVRAPFDIYDRDEVRVRDGGQFVAGLRTPTWLFVGAGSARLGPVRRLGKAAAVAGVPLHTIAVNGAGESDLVRPVTRLLAARLAADVGPTCSLSLTDGDVQAAFQSETLDPPTLHDDALRLTPTAAVVVRQYLDAKPAKPILRCDLDLAGGLRFDAGDRPLLESFNVTNSGIRLSMYRTTLIDLGPQWIDFAASPTPHLFLTPQR